jgi:hypothetical protein
MERYETTKVPGERNEVGLIESLFVATILETGGTGGWFDSPACESPDEVFPDMT